MKVQPDPTPAPLAHHVQFEVRDGIRRVMCNVADEALEAVSGLAGPSNSVSRRRSFDRFRTLLDAAAKLKLRTMSADFTGPLLLTSGDLRRVPPEFGVPAYGTAARLSG
jgi:hypothetical protein